MAAKEVLPIGGVVESIVCRWKEKGPSGRKEYGVRCAIRKGNAISESYLWQNELHLCAGGNAAMQRYTRSLGRKGNADRDLSSSSSAGVEEAAQTESRDDGTEILLPGRSAERRSVRLGDSGGVPVELVPSEVAAGLGITLSSRWSGAACILTRNRRVALPSSDVLSSEWGVKLYANYFGRTVGRLHKVDSDRAVRAFLGFVHADASGSERLRKYGMGVVCDVPLLNGFFDWMKTKGGTHNRAMDSSTIKNRLCSLSDAAFWLDTFCGGEGVGVCDGLVNQSAARSAQRVILELTQSISPESRKRREDTLSLELAVATGQMCSGPQLQKMLEACAGRMDHLLGLLEASDMTAARHSEVWIEYEMYLLWYAQVSIPTQRREVFANLSAASLSLENGVFNFTRIRDKNERERLRRSNEFLNRPVVLARECTKYMREWTEKGRPFLKDFPLANEEENEEGEVEQSLTGLPTVFLRPSGTNIRDSDVTVWTRKVSLKICGRPWTPQNIRHIRATLFYYAVFNDERLTLNQKSEAIEKYSRFIANSPATFYMNYVYKSSEMRCREGMDLVEEANRYLRDPQCSAHPNDGKEDSTQPQGTVSRKRGRERGSGSEGEPAAETISGERAACRKG